MGEGAPLQAVSEGDGVANVGVGIWVNVYVTRKQL